MATPDGRTVLMVTEAVWARHRERILATAPDLEPLVYSGPEPFGEEELAAVDIAFFSADCWPERSRGFVVSLLKAPGLSWLQTFSAGVDNQVFSDLVSRGVRLTTASGSSAVPIAETVMLYMLALGHDLRGWMRGQDRREWDRHVFTELSGSRLAVVGMGPIGTAVARLGIAFGMDVEAVRRTPRGDEPCPVETLGHLHEVLGRADWVVCALPLAPATAGLFDAGAFAAMRRGARFINVGRGDVVDEGALVDALAAGHLGGAGLDVFSVEPLPATSPLWSMENVIITPHNSATSTAVAARTEEIFLDNLRRWSAGGTLANLVT